jgi:hypothetical protein
MKAWLRYFIPRPRWKPVPRVLVTKLSAKGASDDELLLIKSGHARSIQHARELMTKYNATTGVECLELLPPPRKVTFWERLHRLILRLAGHDDRDIYRRRTDNRIDVEYRYK